MGRVNKNYISATAEFSINRKYRYALLRVWDLSKPRLSLIGLNPSSANAHKDDPTIRRCVDFADREGYGSIVIHNLFAYITSNPSKLLSIDDPVGPDNDMILRSLMEYTSQDIWVMWGSSKIAKERVKSPVIQNLSRMICLGISRSGQPKHPLYLRVDTPFEPFKF